MSAPARDARGFILLPVVLALTLIAAIAFLLHRDGGMNVSMAARGLQADSARYVAEAGLAQLNYQTQNRNCSGYTNLSGRAFGADSFSATVTPTSGTPVTYTSTGTLATGASAQLTRSNVIVLQTTQQSKTLQPATWLDDTYISALSWLANYGADTVLTLQGNGINTLLRFDLSSIPTGSFVQSAQLLLYKPNSFGNASNQAITAYPMTRAWVEGTKAGSIFADGATWGTSNGSTSWSSNGGDYDSTLPAVLPYDNNSGWKAWNVTDIVSGWVRGGYPNNGMILVPSPGMPNISFVSGNDTGQRSNTPKLSVVFYPPCGWSAPATSVTLTPNADGYIDSDNDKKNYGASTVLGLEGPAGGQNRLLLSFNTSGITPGTLVVSATLRFYVGSITNPKNSIRSVQAFGITEAWVEGSGNGTDPADGATWKRKNATTNWNDGNGGSYASTAAATLSVPASFLSGWIELDLQALTQQWVDLLSPNRGVIIKLSTDETFNVNSRENSSNQPQLVIGF